MKSPLYHLMCPVALTVWNNYLPFFVAILILSVAITDAHGQTSSRHQLEQERVGLEEQINLTRQLLDESLEEQKSTVENYVALQNQLEARRRMLQNIQQQMQILNDTMRIISDSITRLTITFESTREVYFTQLRISYLRQLTTRDWMYLLSSGNLNEALRRYLYSQQFRSFIERRKTELDSISSELQHKKELLQQSLSELEELQQRERSTVNALNRDLRNQDALLNSLRGKEKELRENLREQERRRRELSREIDRLIAEEIARRAEVVDELPERAAEFDRLSGSFQQNKGKIPWPVERGIIQSRFGSQPHPTLRNVTIQNNGIDIRTQEGAMVRAVFEGEVTALVSMPGDQKMILIRHGDYFTVYAGLQTSYVARGEAVNAGQELGLAGKDPGTGNHTVHFELWRGKTMLNPEDWISR
ncbi:MAG: hypothetical protein EA409_01105 [Saprospirales bacterium]|nr:MAG: hypothetical protein EA409_01105 [Saprospirales bacterium]